jgi:hypothetical protein
VGEGRALITWCVGIHSSLAAKLYLFCPSGRELLQKNIKVYLVPHFEDCPPGGTVDWEFILWGLNGIF